MNKFLKVSIIIIIVFAIAILSLWLISIFKEKQGQPETTINETSENLPSSQPVQLPGSSQGQEVFHDSSIRVEDLDSKEQVQAAFEKYVDQNTNDFPEYLQDGISTDYPVNDESGKIVDLQTFFSFVGANINPQVKKMINSSFYALYYCPNENGQKAYGIAFDAIYPDSNNLQSQSGEMKGAMKKWEPYILKDLHFILFPDDNISENDLNQASNFRDGEFRYADINISGKSESIDYAVKTDEGNGVNRIYITTSQECLKKSLDYLFDY
ncbi:MAG: hypothetical protein PHF35_02385 [Candidatus Moranbacteria bacterium]|nr:hypothetical protein [Candidatus Moranbacteria bacterium]